MNNIAQLRQSIRLARRFTGLTQKELALKLDWPLSKIIDIEDTNETFTLSDLTKLANILGYKVSLEKQKETE